MSSRYNRYRSYSMDSARAFINIDDIMRAFSSAEKAEGLPETFIEINPSDDTDKDTQNNTHEDDVPKEKKKTPFACGRFDMSLDGFDIDDDDDTYVCEMCDSLGYSGKYIPEICDTCKACAGCMEYDEGECSGCSYSVYRDGEYYHEKLPESELISEHDLELFGELEKPSTHRFVRVDGVGKIRNR